MSNLTSRFKTLLLSRHSFPLLVLLCVFVLSVLGISGTSSGVFYRIEHGSSDNDTQLLIGRPRDIRSDEWIVITQLTKAQQAENYPRYNQNIALGNDMSVVLDVPYREWSILFRPQNLPFFVLPFDIAFALKWWSLFALLIISTYYLALRFTASFKLAALLALSFSMSPFIMWWYLTITLGTMAFGVTALLLAFRIYDNRNLRIHRVHLSGQQTRLVLSLMLTYFAVCYALVLYPPFQIAVGLVCGVFFLSQIQYKNLRVFIRHISPVILGLVVAGVIVGLFVYTRIDAINVIQHTAYPGVRSLANGGGRLLPLFNGFLAPQFQSMKFAQFYYTNQSEASMFFYHGLYLFPVTLYLALRQGKSRKKVIYSLGLIVILLAIFFAKMYITELSWFSKLLLLNKVTWERLMSGFGLLSFFTLLLWIRQSKTIRQSSAILYSFILFLALLWTGFFIRSSSPGFIESERKILFLAGIYSVILYLYLRKKHLAATSLVLLYTLASVGLINPLYRGSQPNKSNEVVESIKTISTDEDTWATANDIILENLPAIAGRKSITGVSPSPNLAIWKSLYPDEKVDTYNRYAHIILTPEADETSNLYNPSPDQMHVEMSCSSPVFTEVDFVLSSSKIALPDCLSLVKSDFIGQKEYRYYRYLR